MKTMEQLQPPKSKTLVCRSLPNISMEDREKVLKATEYNVFSFPAKMLVLDFLSDSGTTAMTDNQWAALFKGDESYGRNEGYYLLLEMIRNTFERGDDFEDINPYLHDTISIQDEIKQLFIKEHEGGFANGGTAQLKRPNAFITPQGRAAEHLLFSTIGQILHEKYPERKFFIPNNGHFDTTEANIRANNLYPVNLLDENLLGSFPIEKVGKENPFKGNMNPNALKEFIKEKGSENIPIIYLTITNNTAAGQPVSLKCIREISKIAKENNIPLFFDACRFAENAYFIKKYENQKKSIPSIIKEMFSHVDGFTMSFKKDGLANIGGGLFFRDKGVFHKKFSSLNEDVGVKIKEKQILTFGNDSYGGLSGRDIMSIAVGLQEVVKEDYLDNRVSLTEYFSKKGHLYCSSVPYNPDQKNNNPLQENALM